LMVRALRDSGEAVELLDLAPPDVPEEENAAALYEKAWLVWKGLPKEMRDGLCRLLEPDEAPDEVELRGFEGQGLSSEEVLEKPRKERQAEEEKELGQARELCGAAGEVVRLFHDAAKRPRCRFDLDYAEAAYDMPLPHLSQFRDSGDLLCLSARLHARDKRADAACADLHAALKLSGATRNEPLLFARLLEAEVRDKSVACLNEIMNDTEPSNSALSELDLVLAKFDGREDLVLAMRGERCFGISVVPAAARDPEMLSTAGGEPPPRTVFGKVRRFLFLPSVYCDGIFYLREAEKSIAYAAKPWHEAKSDYAAMEKTVEAQISLSGKAPSFMLPVTLKAALAYDVCKARGHTARLGIALRRYRMKHGEYPDKLDALTPAFIDTLPVDPFSGKDYVYRRAGKGFIVYSIGGNGVDDGGVDSRHISEGDVVFRISR